MTRVAIVSDVHGERCALERLIARIECHGVDAVVSLGDLLDRGPDSLGTLRLVRRHRFLARDGRRRHMELVLGNHELAYVNAALGRPMTFADGTRGIPRARSKEIADGLTPDDITWLDSRSRFLRIRKPGLDLLLVHGGILPQHARVTGWLGHGRLDQLTRIGWLDEATGEPLHPSRSSRLHWAHTYRRQDGPRVVFGHVSWPRITRFENAIGADCSKHGRIAALIVSAEGEDDLELYEETGSVVAAGIPVVDRVPPSPW